jgi:hypothetical protein
MDGTPPVAFRALVPVFTISIKDSLVDFNTYLKQRQKEKEAICPLIF